MGLPYPETVTSDVRSDDRDVSDLADQTADHIRTLLINGAMKPGQQLSESVLAAAVGVSRNTLREAFRVLIHERLLVRKHNRGVFVEVPTVSSLIDIYRVRRIIEGQAVRGAIPKHPAIERVRAAVERAAASRESGDWIAVGTANMEFHAGIVSLADSPRLDKVFENLSAELRIAFGVLESPEYLHEPYVTQNATIAEMLTAARFDAVAEMLDAYLTHSERIVLAAYGRLNIGFD